MVTLGRNAKWVSLRSSPRYRMKKPISATIDTDLIEWISKECEDKRRYRNKSHLIEIALETLKTKNENLQK